MALSKYAAAVWRPKAPEVTRFLKNPLDVALPYPQRFR